MPEDTRARALTSRQLIDLLVRRREHTVVFRLEGLGLRIPVTGVTYLPHGDDLALEVFEDEVCLRGYCYEIPETPGRCPHGFSVYTGDASDHTASLRYLHPTTSQIPDEWGDGFPKDYEALYTAQGLLIRTALRHALEARTAVPNINPNTCCPKCCDQCRALAWYSEYAPALISTAISTLRAAGDPGDARYQYPDHTVNWLALSRVWEDSELLGCHTKGN